MKVVIGSEGGSLFEIFKSASEVAIKSHNLLLRLKFFLSYFRLSVAYRRCLQIPPTSE